METKAINCPTCGSSNFYTISDNMIRCQYCGANIFIDRQPGAAPQQNPIINLSNDTDILDSQAKEYQLASNMQRLANYFVDWFFIYFILFIGIAIVGNIEPNPDAVSLLAFLVIPFYYTLLEGSNGKTIGKYLSRTRVVNEDGSKISYGRAFLRTLCRFIPFEALSIFFNPGVCWHDSIPKTRVIRDR